MPHTFLIDCLIATQYEADLSKLRTSFEEHGEIKEFFDLVQKRGMVFITYVRIALLRPPKFQPDSVAV